MARSLQLLLRSLIPGGESRIPYPNCEGGFSASVASSSKAWRITARRFADRASHTSLRRTPGTSGRAARPARAPRGNRRLRRLSRVHRQSADRSGRGAHSGSVRRCQRQRDPPCCARSFPNALCGTRSTRHPRAERRALQPRSSGVAGTCQQRQSWLVECVGERLGFNPCVQRPADYDRFEPPPSWALTTLGHHVTDPRPVTYSLEQFEAAETHDALGRPPRAS